MAARHSGHLGPEIEYMLASKRGMRQGSQKMWLQPCSKWGLKMVSRQIEHSKSTPGWIDVTVAIAINCRKIFKVSSQRPPPFPFSSWKWFAVELLFSILQKISFFNFQQYCSGIKSMCENIQLNSTVFSIQNEIFYHQAFWRKKVKNQEKFNSSLWFAAIWQIFFEIFTHEKIEPHLRHIEERDRDGVDRIWGR